MGNILVHGFINVDQLAVVDDFKLDQETDIKQLEILPGGSAANVAVGLSRLLEKRVKFLGAVGDDANSYLLKDSMEKVNLDSLQKINNTASGFTFTVVNKLGLRTMFTYPGANLDYNTDATPTDTFQDVDLIHLSSPKIEVALELIDKLDNKNTKVSFDPSSLLTINGLPYLKEIISKVDILFLNEDELSHLFPNESHHSSLDMLHSLGVTTIFIKLGSKGALMSTYEENRKNIIEKPAKKINPLDSTGAGDAFSVGVIYGILKDYSNSLILECGINNSASVMEELGARKGLLYNL